MRRGKLAATAVCGLVVVAAVIVAATILAPGRGESQQNFPPAEGQAARSQVGDAALYSRSSGNSSFLYRKDRSGAEGVRLTTAVSGIESEASFSHAGKFVVYSFATSPESKSAVWVVGSDGSNPHRITGKDEDALHPVFSPDDLKVYYAASSFTGHNSPIIRPARHDWDVFSISVQTGLGIAASAPFQITHSSFYDMQSLDVSADGITPGGTKVLVSTTGYPIGSLFEEFNTGSTGKQKIFQPHVPGEAKIGPSFGEARFIHDGMDILFLAATDISGGNYDYNVYSMSDVTGGEIRQLTNLRGMTIELKVMPGGKATVVNAGVTQELTLLGK